MSIKLKLDDFVIEIFDIALADGHRFLFVDLVLQLVAGFIYYRVSGLALKNPESVARCQKGEDKFVELIWGQLSGDLFPGGTLSRFHSCFASKQIDLGYFSPHPSHRSLARHFRQFSS